MTQTNTVKPWGGRFDGETDAFVEAFTASVAFDKRLAAYDIQGSIAHARMLAKIGVLTADECTRITDGLNAIAEEIARGDFVWSTALEDVHMNIEARLVARIGDTGKKLHTARSRNDQIALDLRLYARDTVDAVLHQLTETATVLITRAEEEAATIMPGFTHLQTAQPITLGHHLLAWTEMLLRDCARFRDLRVRINVCPLGAAALAGTSFPIDRAMVAEALGFSAVCENSLDAVSDRDFVIETINAAALVMMHLSRMAEELIIWASTPFHCIDLPDAYCTGSSIMPQKKNPDVPELVRGKTGRVFGHLIGMLTVMKAQPLAYNKDNQEDKEPLFDTFDTVLASLRGMRGVFAHMLPQRDTFAALAGSGYSVATDFADYLVRRAVPFREAHEIVGRTVRVAVSRDVALADLTLVDFKAIDVRIDADVYDVLHVEGSVNARSHFGGTAPDCVRAAATRARDRIHAFIDNT